MYSLASFSISDMIECASDLRKLGAEVLSARDVLQTLVVKDRDVQAADGGWKAEVFGTSNPNLRPYPLQP